MLEKLQTYFLYGTTYCGIEHTSDSTVEAILLKKKKVEVSIENAFSEKTIEAIAQKLPKKQHAFLIVNDDAVLSKHIQSTEKLQNR